MDIRHSSFFIPRKRRGTALVFVLGVLTLLALVGLLLIARTHGEFQRIANQSASSNYQSVLDGVLRTVQETLRRDIWGNDPNPQLPLTNIGSGLQEKNEPWDAPGIDDRWLASLLPFDAGTAPQVGAIPTPGGTTLPPIGDPTALIGETNVLMWPSVSYLGTDILTADHQKTGNQPYAWPYNSRQNPPPGTPTPTFYSDKNLQNVPMLQTPPVPALAPAGANGPLIPGSTTNVTIAAAFADWKAKLAQSTYSTPLAVAIGAGPGSPKVPLFPYFDTNADGILDLYDADGDGIPDSPISSVIPLDGGGGNGPRNLYAAVRIVDHNAMLNVNVASSLRKPGGVNTDESFDESRFWMQRRGQRTTELLLDAVVHPEDRDYSSNGERVRGLMNSRTGNDPVGFDRDIVRSKLIGGTYGGPLNYYLLGMADEASLRHRGTLTPYDRRFDATAGAGDYGNIDRALRNTLLWTREVDGFGGYTGSVARWSRLNSNYEKIGPPAPTAYEGYDSGAGKGWRYMLSEDETFAIRRPLFTTVSHDVQIGPDIIRRPLNANETADGAINARLQQLWALGMDWPVLISTNDPVLGGAPPWFNSSNFCQKFVIPAGVTMPPPVFRVQPIDLNMGDANTAEAKAAFTRYAAAAMYLALEGVSSYQGIELLDNPGTPQNETLNREYLAWQFALNLVDYRDNDNEPSKVEWPAGSGHYIFGVEKQPFFTEAYAYLRAGDTPGVLPVGPLPSSGAFDRWFFAVELYVPPYWNVDSANLYLRIPQSAAGVVNLYPFTDFQHRTAGTPPGIMSGGPTGKYFVFCGLDSRAPDSMKLPTGINHAAYQQFYQFQPHPGLTDFRIPTDGTGRIELVYQSPTIPLHTLDVIGPQYTGGPLADGAAPAIDWAVATIAGPLELWEYSLLRSTNGWRFATDWQVYKRSQVVVGPAPSSGAAVQQTLGRANEPYPIGSALNQTSKLDKNIPESPWAARAMLSGGAMPPDFDLASPYTAFDSAADVSRILMVGPQTQTATAYPILRALPTFYGGAVPDQVPTTAIQAAIMSDMGASDLPQQSPTNHGSLLRLAAGHPDFAPYKTQKGLALSVNNGMKYLLSYLTTQSPLFDGIDNDGNGLTDMGLGGGVADPLEGYAVLNRIAGQINVNTAPASVLRSVPFMSLLPNSPEYLFHVVMGGGSSPIPANYNAFNTFNLPAPRPFWDFAGAIVAAREGRSVPLRLIDPTVTILPPGITTQLRTVAVASPQPASLSVGPAPSSGSSQYLKGPYKSIADLARLNDRNDTSASNDDDVFNIDRYVSNAALRVFNHNDGADPALGPASPLSPDYRFRRTAANDGIVEFAPILPAASPSVETAGLRARDAFLSRWTNLLTTRSDVFTAYVALIDENGNYVQRSQVTMDRSGCFREQPAYSPGVGQPIPPRRTILPEMLSRVDTSYTDDTK